MNNDDIINVNPETGEVEEPTFMEKVKVGVVRHSGLIAGIVGVIIGTIATLVSMRNAECEEDDVDAGDE